MTNTINVRQNESQKTKYKKNNKIEKQKNIKEFIKKQGKHTVKLLNMKESKRNTRIVQINVEGLTKS